MLSVRLPKETEDRLNALSALTHRSRSYYVKKAIDQFLDDREDYFLAVQAMEEFEQDQETYSIEEIQEKYGLKKSDKH